MITVSVFLKKQENGHYFRIISVCRFVSHAIIKGIHRTTHGRPLFRVGLIPTCLLYFVCGNLMHSYPHIVFDALELNIV